MFLCLTIGVFCSNGKLTKDKCSQMLSDAGASSKFAGSVAHAVHSMTVDDLKKFYPTANENNYVPTVNKDLKANKAILLYAPDVNMSNGTFITDGMKTLDIVLSRMDDKQWDIKNYSPLEKLVHAFHMKEVWAKALKQFDLIKSNPPNLETCYCALDIGHNGVMDVMKYLALVIREPSLVYGNPALKDFNWDGNVYRFNFLYVYCISTILSSFSCISLYKILL